MNDWLDAETRAERAQELSESERWSEALCELNAAIDINPNDPTWHIQRGQILDHLQRYDEAIEAYDSALALAVENAEIETVLAIDLIRVGRYEKAVKLLEDLSRRCPDFEPAYCYRIAAYTRLARHDEAEQMFYLAQQITESCPNCYHHLAESLACRGKLDRAIYCWQRALEIEPDYPHARQRVAEAYRVQGKLEQAREFFLAAWRREPGNANILAELGDLLIEMDHLTEAEAKFRQVLDLQPDSVRANVMMGLIRSQQEDPDGAMPFLQDALEADEHYPGLRSHLGETELRRGNHYEALRHLSIALEDDPDDLIALMAMGNCLLELFRPEEAATHFEHMIELEPTMAGPHHNLAVCQFLQDEFDKGIQHCLDALDLEPTNVMFMHKLALAYVHLGRFRDAREVIDRALITDPTHPALRRLKQRLWNLRIRHMLRSCLPHRSTG